MQARYQNAQSSDCLRLCAQRNTVSRHQLHVLAHFFSKKNRLKRHLSGVVYTANLAMSNIAFRLIALSCCLTLAMAQHHSSTENPVVLYKGLGIWQHPIHTSNPEAQKFFDQGLALMYGFNRYEALRSFRRASELDPQAAMTFWGMAMAQGPYINMDGDPSYDLKSACAAVEKGSKLTQA